MTEKEFVKSNFKYLGALKLEPRVESQISPSQIREPPALYWVPFLLCLQTLHHEHSVWSKRHLCHPRFKDPLSKQPFEKCMLLSCEHLLCSSYGPLGGEGRHCSPDISGKFPVTWHPFHIPKSCRDARIGICITSFMGQGLKWRKRIFSSKTSLKQWFFSWVMTW